VQHRWAGKCPDCGEWDSLEEHREEKADPHFALAAEARGAVGGATASAPSAARLDAIDQALVRRVSTGIGELDRVLGGTEDRKASGLVPGSSILLGGPPGIGKSTLTLQMAGSLAKRGVRVLYVSSEESGEQIAMRATRLGIDPSDELLVLPDTNLARIFEQIRKVRPGVIVLDSIQMVYKADLDATPGSVAQLRRCAAELVTLSKSGGSALVLVGHVTKEGQIAGPRLLEHMVDAVLYFEGDRYHAHRMVRGVKNRFGTTLEVGIFEMTAGGLREAPEGAGVSGVLGEEARPGSVVCPVMTGTRCVLVEMQALTATGFLGSAKRKASGVDSNRLAMLIAVLEQHAGLRLADRDVFASSVGGLKVGEPASDLALLLAIAGAHFKRALAPATAVVGEVGLGGEVRSVSHLDQRVREAVRLGFKRLVVPKGGTRSELPKGVEMAACATVGQAIEQLG
jgi:DNA repair protein RadA/Sms